MSSHPPVDVSTIPPIDRAEAHELTLEEGRRFATLLGDLEPPDWARPTDCDRWTVHDVAAHVIGSAASQAAPRELVRQALVGRRHRKAIGSPHWWDGANEVQVLDRRDATPDALREEWSTLAPVAARSRARIPRPVGRLPLLVLPEPVGRQPLSYLVEMGFTRDVWVHRFDIALATGRPLDLDDHDARIVADIVAEWSGTHGEPFDLVLDGAGGGRFVQGGPTDPTTSSTVELARALSGRIDVGGLLRHPLPL